jgi:hypothetical protein
VSERIFCLLCYINRAGWRTGNGLDSYSGGARYESAILLKNSVGFRSPFRLIAGNTLLGGARRSVLR